MHAGASLHACMASLNVLKKKKLVHEWLSAESTAESNALCRARAHAAHAACAAPCGRATAAGHHEPAATRAIIN